MNGEMHLVVDARMIRHAGIGVYLSNLLPRIVALRPGWRVSALMPHDFPSKIAGVASIPCHSDIYTFAEQRELVAAIPADTDLLWSPHYNVPLLSRMPWVVTVHDVAHLARPEGRHVQRLARLAYARLFLNQVRRRARRVLFVSEFSRQQFFDLVGTPRASTVIYNGVDDSWRTEGAQPRPHARPYVVFVGSVKPHKNLRGLLRAFGLLADRVPHDLVIIGATSGMRTVDNDAINEAMSAGPRIRFVGRVEDDVLRAYVSNADALAFPSTYEGFGLPPLEAMAAGVPAVVSDIPVLREVCADAAEYCNPDRPDEIAAKLETVLTDSSWRETLIERGHRRAAAFSWDTAAAETVAALADAVPGGGALVRSRAHGDSAS